MTEVAGFAEGFIRTAMPLMRLRMARDQAVRDEEMQKEQIKLLRQRVAGQEADRKLKEAQVAMQMQQIQQRLLGQRALGGLISMSPTQERQDVGVGPLSFEGEQAETRQQLMGDLVGSGVEIPEQLSRLLGLPQEPVTLKQGESLVDPSTGRTVASIPPREQRVTETMLAARAAQGDKQAIRTLQIMRGQRRSGATQVNIGPQGQRFGNPPKDMVWGLDAQGNVMVERDEATGAFRPIAVPVKGSKVDMDVRKAAKGEKIKRGQELATANIIVDDIGTIVKMIDQSPTPIVGALGGSFARVPGTNAFDVARLLDTIRANIGLQRLQQMREASPTGGALGSVTERENELLQSVMGNLSQSQSKEQFLRNIGRIHDLFLDIIHDDGKGPTRMLPKSERIERPKMSGAATDTPEQRNIRRQLKQQGMTDEEINKAIGRN